MTKDEALQMCLEYIETNAHERKYVRHAIKEALAQQEAEAHLQAVSDFGQLQAQSEQEPLEYWNAVEGWVKIDEVRQHFETVSCGTIYKNAGEGRVPLYTTPPKREWIGLTDDERKQIRFNFDGMESIQLKTEAKLKELNHD